MHDQTNTGIDWFGNGSIFIYIAVVVPLLILLSLWVFNKLKASQQAKFFTYLIIIIYILFTLLISIGGLYVFMLLFYGLAS